jgi:hypothetical protein
MVLATFDGACCGYDSFVVCSEVVLEPFRFANTVHHASPVSQRSYIRLRLTLQAKHQGGVRLAVRPSAFISALLLITRGNTGRTSIGIHHLRRSAVLCSTSRFLHSRPAHAASQTTTGPEPASSAARRGPTHQGTAVRPAQHGTGLQPLPSAAHRPRARLGHPARAPAPRAAAPACGTRSSRSRCSAVRPGRRLGRPQPASLPSSVGVHGSGPGGVESTAAIRVLARLE